METLQTIIVIENLALTLVLGITAAWFYSRSGRIMDLRVFGLLTTIWFYGVPGVLGAFSPTLLRIVVPLERPDTMLAVALALPLMVISILAGLLIRWGPPKRPSLKRQRKLLRRISARYRLGRLFLFSVLCLALAIIGAWMELHAAGGWLAVIRGGGKAYLEARVTKAVGFWAVLLSLFPVATIGLMYCALHSRVMPRGLGTPVAAIILVSSTGIVALLTTRHLIVMLLLSLVALLEIRSRELFRFIVPIALALIAVGAFALSSIRYSSRVQSIDELTGNFEHIEIAERIAATVHISGYIWGGNIPDLFTFAVPRAVWPNKPMGGRITRNVFVEYAKVGGIKVPGLIGESYASGGLVGVVLEGFIFGVLLRRLTAFWDRRRGSTLQFTSWGALVVGFTYMAVRMGMIGLHDTTFLVLFLQIYVINRFCAVRRKDPLPQSVPVVMPTRREAAAVT